jgi:hypothetical protein
VETTNKLIATIVVTTIAEPLTMLLVVIVALSMVKLHFRTMKMTTLLLAAKCNRILVIFMNAFFSFGVCLS